jgi:hypothetical protein
MAKETAKGVPDKDGIRQTFEKHQNDLIECSKENPTVKGKLALDCDIDENGKASNVMANPESSQIKDEKMVNCLKNKMAAWEFPKSAKGETAHISYPLSFRGKQ